MTSKEQKINRLSCVLSSSSEHGGMPAKRPVVLRRVDGRVPARVFIGIFAGAALLISAIICMSPINAYAATSLVMNLTAANDSDDVQTTPLVQYLPTELSKEDVLDTAGLQLRYDDKRSALYLFDNLTLQPKETKKYRVAVRDVWQIPKEDLDFLKTQAKSRLDFLEGTDDQQAGQLLYDRIMKELTAIEAAQSQESTIPQRIEQHRLAAEKIATIRSQVTVMSDYVKNARWLKASTQSTDTVKLQVQIKNPLEEPMESQKVIRYLPRGVSPEDVIEAQGFDIKYDPERSLYYLYREVSLKPSESLTATVVFRNNWKIPTEKLDSLIQTAQDFKKRLEGTQYEETGGKILAELEQLSTQIKELQAKSENPADMIANFSINLTRFNAVEDGVHKLKELVEEIEHPVPQTLPYYIKPATPDVSTTWKIIYGFIGFLTVLGLMFYALWWGQSKAKLNRKYESHKV